MACERDRPLSNRELATGSGSGPTIGLLVNSPTDPRGTVVWSGAVEAARRQGASLVCFPVGSGEDPSEVLYGLVSSERIDGLVVCLYTDLDEFRHIHHRCGALPVVNVLRLYPGYPGVVADNYQGMRDLLGHLVEVHDYRRIAFVRGLEGNIAADERYRAYVDAVAEYQLEADPGLLVLSSPAGHFNPEGGHEAVRALLDERRLGVDVIVTCADSTALGALEALGERGLQVPYDMAVTGFDDVPESRVSLPPLTTVAQPMHEMGRRAVDLLLRQLSGKEVPEQTLVPCELFVRQSCRCWSAAIGLAGAAMVSGDETAWSAVRDLALSESKETLARRSASESAGSVENLVDAFLAELRDHRTGMLLPALDSVLRQSTVSGDDVSAWQDVLSVLRHHCLSSEDCTPEARRRGEELVGQGRVLVSEAVHRAETLRQTVATERVQTVLEVGQSLVASFDLEWLASVVTQELPGLGIPAFWLSMYEDPNAPAEWSRMIVAYDQDGPAAAGLDDQRFPSGHLVPGSALTGGRVRSLLVEPLFVQEEQVGFAVFEMGPLDGQLYEQLQGQLAAAMRGAALVQQTQRNALQLRTAAEVGRVASSVLDPDELVQRVVDLVLERLDLYYAGLFLMDQSGEWTGEPGRWAVLRAGTGQAGRQMIAKEHKLAVGGESMIGQCIARGAARIALDTGQEAVRFENPQLPHTRSELALPLISRGQVIGAMTIQSALSMAFSQDDIAALQLMADQLANAIQTASLYAESQEAVERTQTLYETSRALSSSLEEASLMRAILEGISRRTDCEYAILSVVDESARTMESRHGLWQGEYDAFPEWIEMSRYSLDERDILVDVYHTAKTEVIEGWDDRFNREIYERYEHERLLRVFMPVQIRDRVLGVIEVAHDRSAKGSIDDSDVQLLRAFVDQAAIALENVRLLAETQRTLEETETLYDASRRLSGASTAAEMVSAVMEGAHIGAADSAFLWTVERSPADEIVSFVSVASWRGTGDAPSFPPGARLLTEQFPSLLGAFGAEPLLSEDVAVNDRVGEGLRAVLERTGIRSLALLPVRSGELLLGTLMVTGREPHAFGDREARLLASLASQMAVGLERLGLLEQMQERLRREQTLREVTDRVRGAVDVESVMRTAVREVGRVLGRPAFVHLGDGGQQRGSDVFGESRRGD